MISKKISKQAAAYIFDNIESYLTNVFLIEKESRFFLIDTFCGSESMTPILQKLNHKADKEVVVINTHFHWDHVWGNCSFKDKCIFSHEKCRSILEECWESQIQNNKMYISGQVEKILPNITFNKRITFHKDGIELFHSPGHTIDSISVFDHEEKVLYVGDNLEKPLIFVESDNIEAYLSTLENYLSYHPKRIAAGHTLDLTEEDILSTIHYLKLLAAGEEINFQTEYERKIHKQNINIIKAKLNSNGVIKEVL